MWWDSDRYEDAVFPDDYYDYEIPTVTTDEAETLDDLSYLFNEEFDEVPFTAAEEEMLPTDPARV